MDIAELGFRVDTSGLAQADKALKDLDKTGKEVGATGEKSGGLIDRSMRNSAGGIGVASSALQVMAGVAATLGLASIAKGAFDMALAFETSMNDVQEKMNLTGQGMQEFRDVATEMGKTTAFSASEVADAMSELASTFSDTDTVLRLLPDTLDLAAAAGIDLSTAAGLTAKTLNQFSLEADQATRVVNLIAGAADASSATVSYFATAMSQAGATANVMGVSVEDTTTAIALMAGAGVEASSAGTALNSMFRQIVNGSKPTMAALDDVGLASENFYKNGKNLEDGFVGLDVAMDLLKNSGADAGQIMKILGDEGRGMIKVIEGGGDGFRAMTANIANMSTAAQQAETKMQGLPGAVKLFKSAWEALNLSLMAAGGTDLAAAALNALSAVMIKIANGAMGTLRESVLDAQAAWISFKLSMQFSDSTVYVALRSIGEAIGFIGSTLAPLLPYISQATAAFLALGAGHVSIGLVSSAVAVLSGAFLALKAVVLANPITASIYAIGISASVIYQNWGNIQSWWSGMWSDMKSAADGFLNWWGNTSLDSKELSIDLALLAIARTAADTFFGWWNGSTLKEHAPQIVVDSMAKAEDMARRFIDWWAANDLKTKVADVKSEIIDAAESVAVRFFDWWNATTLSEKLLEFDLLSLEFAESIATAFFGWWNGSQLKEHAPDVVVDALESAEVMAMRFFDWWGSTDLATRALDVETALLNAAESVARAFVGWWSGMELEAKTADIKTLAVEAAKKVVGDFVSWWKNTPLEDKTLAVDMKLLDLAKTGAQAFFTWWDQSTLKEHAPKIVVDAVDKARELSETFFDWWNSTDLEERIADVKTEALDTAKSVAEAFFGWWNGADLEAMKLAVESAALEAAETIARAFVFLWNNFTIVGHILPISTEMLDSAKDAAEDFVAWWDDTDLEEKVADIKTAAIDAARGVGEKFVDWWKSVPIAEREAIIDTASATAAEVVITSFAILWNNHPFVPQSLEIDASQVENAKTVMSDFISETLKDWANMVDTIIDTDIAGPMSSMWADVSKGADGVWDGIVEGVKYAFADIGKLVDEFKLTFSALFGDGSGLTQIFANGWHVLVAVTDGVWVLIKASVKAGWDLAVGVLTAGLQLLRGDFKEAWLTIGETIYELGDNLIAGATQLWPKMMALGKAMFAYVADGLRSQLETISGIASDLVDAIWEGLTALGQRLFDAGVNIAGDLVDGIKSRIPFISRESEDVGVQIPKSVADGIDSSTAPAQATDRMIDQVTDGAAAGLVPKMEQAGSDGGEGFFSGITGWFGQVFGAGEGLGEEAIDGVKTSTETQSPSKALMRVGNDVGLGFAIGIEQSTAEIQRAAGLAGTAAVEEFARLNDAVIAQRIELVAGEDAARLYALALKGITGEAAASLLAAEKWNAELAEQERISDRVAGVLKDLAIEQASLVIELEKGATAADEMRYMTEGYDQADAALAVTLKESNEELREKIRQSETVTREMNELKDAQYLQNIELTQGADAAKKAELGMRGYSDELADNAIETANNMEFQREFYDTLKDSLMNAGSIKDVFSDMGGFIKNWLKDLITTFATNKIMVMVGMGDTGGVTGGLSNMFSSISSMFSSTGEAGTGFGGVLNSVKGLFAGAGGEGGGFGGVLNSVKGLFTGAGGEGSGFGNILGTVKGMFTGTGQTASGLGSVLGNVSASIGSTFGSFGGLIGASNAASAGVATLADATNVAAGGMNSAATSVSSSIMGGLGAAASVGFLAYNVAELAGAANATAVGITTAIGMLVGGPLGAGIGAVIGSMFGGAWEAVDKGFDLAYHEGELSGNATTYMEKERSFWRGTAREIIYSELDVGISSAVGEFFTDLARGTVALAKQLGIDGADEIMDSYSIASTSFKGTAEEIGEQMAQYYEDASRQAYQVLFDRFGPELQAGISDSVDMIEGPMEVITARFADVVLVTENLIPVLATLGISIGDTADEAQANGLIIADSMGGASVAVQELAAFADKFAPSGAAASESLRLATIELNNWNASMGLGQISIGQGVTIFNDYIKTLDDWSTSGSGASDVVEMLGGSIDSATGALLISIPALEEYRNGIERSTEAGREAWDIANALLISQRRLTTDMAETVVANTALGQSLIATASSSDLAADVTNTFVTGLDDVGGALTLNTIGLDLYMSTLDRTTEAGERAWQEANALGEAFDYTSESAIMTSDQMYEYAKSLDWNTEAGYAAAQAAIAVADSLLVIEQENNRLLLSLAVVTEATRTLGLRFDETSPFAIGVADAMVELMGGMEAFTAATGNYYDKFYSEAEKTNLQMAANVSAVQAFNNSLSEADLALAGITDGTIDSAAEFRAFAEAQDINTVAGRENLRMVFEATDAMYALTESGMSMEEAIASLPPELQAAYDLMLGDTAEFASALPADFVSALTVILDEASRTGDEMQSVLLTSFDAMLADAGVTADQLPIELQNAYNLMTDGASALAAELPTDLLNALELIVTESDQAGADMQAGLLASFDTMLADANVTADQLPLELQVAYDAMAGGASDLAAELPVDFLAALEAITTGAAEAGAGMQADLVASFDKMLADAGITADQLPIELQNAYDLMKDGASALAVDLPTDLINALGVMVTEAGNAGADMQATLLLSFDRMMADAGITAAQLPLELQTAYDAMKGGASALAVELPVDFLSALTAITVGASEAGAEMQADMLASFDKMLADAGVTADQLPVELQAAYDEMSAGVSALSAELPTDLLKALAEIVDGASTAGAEMQGDLLASFDMMMADAGVVASQLPPELQAGYTAMMESTGATADDIAATFSGMSTQTQTANAEMSASWESSMNSFVLNAGIAGTGIETALTSAYDAVIADTTLTGAELSGALNAAFTQVLADAGILKTDLPAAAQHGFDLMVSGATTAATDLVAASDVGINGLDDLGLASGELGDDAIAGGGKTRVAAADVLQYMTDAARTLSGETSKMAMYFVIAAGSIEKSTYSAYLDIVMLSSGANGLKTAAAGASGPVFSLSSAISSMASAASAASSSIRSSASAASSSAASAAAAAAAVPKLSTGHPYIPYDEFPALLHEGERVLTKVENEQYSGIASNSSQFSAPISPVGSFGNDGSAEELKAIRRELEMLRQENRQDARQGNGALGAIVTSTQQQTSVIQSNQKDTNRVNRQLVKALA